MNGQIFFQIHESKEPHDFILRGLIEQMAGTSRRQIRRKEEIYMQWIPGHSNWHSGIKAGISHPCSIRDGRVFAIS